MSRLTLQYDPFSIDNPVDFNGAALELFHYQYKKNAVYKVFVDNLRRLPSLVKGINDIPFMPVEFFRDHTVYCGNTEDHEMVFKSSGTTGSTPSMHFIKNISFYEDSFLKCFNRFYGQPEDYMILALLPSYIERKHSSLVYMMDKLIAAAGPGSRFYLNDLGELVNLIERNQNSGIKLMIWGVSFALLDLAEQFQINIPNSIVVETGGMKGRRQELTRQALHDKLKSAFNLEVIHSEYGMTELLSQAYSFGNGIFQCPPWMKVLARDVNDPLSILPANKTGGLNIIDLANRDSCAFIATQDLGKIYDDEKFEVLGRFDHSDIRGCNLMIS